MYTQCPNCDAIFSMTGSDLGTHQGLVRCGQCREVFNATWNLVDTLPDEVAAVDETPTEETLSDIPLIDPGEVTDDIDLDEGPRLPRIDDEPALEITQELEPGAALDPGKADPELTPGLLEVGTPTEPRSPLLVPAVLLEPEATAQTDQPVAAGPPDGAVKPSQVEQEPPDPGKTARSETMPNAEEVTEEIVIEAPSVLWNIEDEIEATEPDPGNDENGAPPPQDVPDKTGQTPTGTQPVRAGTPERRSISATRTATDVKLVEIPYPRPMKTVAWALGAVLLLLGIVWQAREFYLTDLAKVPWMRAPLITFCEYTSCTVPPRTDIKSIDLVSTSVDPHPVTPGALRVSANLVNRAKFEQQFPPLEVTLTDREGNTVGRRTYLPHEYRVGLTGHMAPNVVERVDLDLAQPAESAVGYEIQLVAR